MSEGGRGRQGRERGGGRVGDQGLDNTKSTAKCVECVEWQLPWIRPSECRTTHGPRRKRERVRNAGVLYVRQCFRLPHTIQRNGVFFFQIENYKYSIFIQIQHSH